MCMGVRASTPPQQLVQAIAGIRVQAVNPVNAISPLFRLVRQTQSTRARVACRWLCQDAKCNS